jgi:starch synthase
MNFANPVPAASLRVLFATSECAPLAKTGGLGDVSAAFPAALRALGVDARVLLPAYRGVAAQVTDIELAAVLRASLHFPAARLLQGTGPRGVPLFLLDCPALYNREGGLYGDSTGVDFKDNAVRFGLLSEVAARLGTAASPVDWRAHIVHANDWQTGLAPAYLHFHADALARSVITVHNLAFQGIFTADTVRALGLPAESFGVNGVEYHGLLSFLKGGLYYADAITTVSPTYAAEIQGEPLGFGMQGLLAGRRESLHGILNGIDTVLWDPERDSRLVAKFSATALAGKAANRAALCDRFALTPGGEVPVAVMVSRLTYQKGIDLVLNAIDALLAMPVALAVLGTGEPAYENLLKELARRHHGRLGVAIGLDESLAHLMIAGADLFLMPSRFEPCGLDQMLAQRYGTLPVVRATGGLVDSVVDFSPESVANGTASGFAFREETLRDFVGAVSRACEAWQNRALREQLQRTAMTRDFSWAQAARHYREVYESVLRPSP